MGAVMGHDALTLTRSILRLLPFCQDAPTTQSGAIPISSVSEMPGAFRRTLPLKPCFIGLRSGWKYRKGGGFIPLSRRALQKFTVKQQA